MTDYWLQENDKSLVGTGFLDLNLTFDVLDHNILIKKIVCYGFEPTAVRWIQSCLSNCEYAFYFNGSYSEVKKMSCGVPQGRCLGPLLFSIFINDLPLVIKQVTMFADDTTLSLSMNDVGQLNFMLDLVIQWITVNKLVINVVKTECMILRSKLFLKSTAKLHLKMGENLI